MTGGQCGGMAVGIDSIGIDAAVVESIGGRVVGRILTGADAAFSVRVGDVEMAGRVALTAAELVTLEAVVESVAARVALAIGGGE